MNRLAFILVVALLAGSCAGPAAAETNWTVGFKGGLALADLGGDDVDSDGTEIRTGFAGGAFAQADVSPNFGVRLEALYHMKGAGAGNSDFELGLNLDYIEFPVLLVGQVPASESATLSAFAGPVLAFNTSSDAEISFDGATLSAPIDELIASFEFALAFGLGAAFDVGSVVISLDGRYQLGMTTIDDGLGDAIFGTPVELDAKNQGWVFMAGVGFPVGGD